MSWDSPIEIIVNQIESAWKEETFRVIQKVCVSINVDRDELIKALQYDRNQYEKGYEDGKKDAAQRWIPVTERLPEKTGKYLVSVKNGNVYAGTFSAYEGAFNCAATAWMELPEPYKEPEDPSHPCADSVMMGE